MTTLSVKPTDIFYNAKIITLDSKQTLAEAMAIAGDKIVAIGSNEEILALGQQDTKRHDVEGQVIVPGFNDSHMHLISLGQGLDGVDLTKARSCADVIRLGQEHLIENANQEWILGRGFNEETFAQKNLPTRSDLDQISSSQPVLFYRVCGHIAIANSRALQLAGIDSGRLNPPGGGIDRNVDTNEPTGVLRETAINLVSNLVPSPTVEDLKRFIRTASHSAASLGLTTVQSNDLNGARTSHNRLQAYRELSEAGELPIRVNIQATMATPDDLHAYIRVRQIQPQLGPKVTLGPLKLFTDGSLGGRTAALTYPYADDSSTSGMPIFTQAELDELTLIAAEANLPMAVHAIGDRAIDMVMDSYEQGKQAVPSWTARVRIIHAQITRADQLTRLAELGIICDIQPIFVPTDLHFVEQRIGKENAKHTYAWKTMQHLGVPTAGGSDSPVEHCNPLRGMHAAITRQDRQGYPQGGWNPQERLSGQEALALFTQGSAYAAQEEDLKGSLSVGKLADFVILPEDPTQVAPEELLTMKVVATYVGGEKVFSLE